MRYRTRLFTVGCAMAQLLVFSTQAHAGRRAVSEGPAASTLSVTAINDPAGHPELNAKGQRGNSVLRAQVLLDRAHFSPGEIDGHYGNNTKRAAAAFNQARKVKAGAEINAATWKALNLDSAPVIVAYTLVAEDLAGPFTAIPEDVADQAKLPALGFESLMEELGERFHVSPKLLATLNSGATPDRAGAIILVPNITGQTLEKTAGMTIRVSKSQGSVEAVDDAGVVVARYPATIGSTHDPLPLGTWKVNGVALNPTFNYNPDLFWDAEAGDVSSKLAPGPNGPVGTAWIDLSKPHYGIHGTSTPATIGRGSSHGCIRLTNWDVIELASIVTPGMSAVLEE